VGAERNCDWPAGYESHGLDGRSDMWDWLTLPRIVVFSLLIVAWETLAIVKGAREIQRQLSRL
jgi:hypothetical protein